LAWRPKDIFLNYWARCAAILGVCANRRKSSLSALACSRPFALIEPLALKILGSTISWATGGQPQRMSGFSISGERPNPKTMRAKQSQDRKAPNKRANCQDRTQASALVESALPMPKKSLQKRNILRVGRIFYLLLSFTDGLSYFAPSGQFSTPT
jgi:hypothetical protein